MSVLRSEHLKKIYKKRTVVKDSSINVNQGETVGLLGPNGAGKTTTFYMIVGFVQPDGGSVFLDDRDITREPMYRRARMGVGYLPQEASVFRKLTVEENILGVLEMSDLPKKEQKERTEKLLEDLNITHIRKSTGYSLSGGERRRTEIARALAIEPKFILLDEPFAGVDPIAVEDIQKIVTDLKKRNIGVLITDHNVHETLSITDRSYLMFEGGILMQGKAEDLASNEQARRLYLGENFKLDRYANSVTEKSAVIFHITEKSNWTKAQSQGHYAADSLATEGFIHFSTATQVAATANRFYKGKQGLVLLVVEPEKLTNTLRYEPSHDELFPHLYGMLNLDAVRDALDVVPKADGTFEWPAGLGIGTA
jgi:lipopolysaccharide export system ATP-binding protein